MEFWPTDPSTGEVWTLFLAPLVAECLVLYIAVVGFPYRFPWGEHFDPGLVGREADRALGIAKGVGGAAAGFLVAVITGLIKDEISREVSGVSLLGCVLGAVGALILAAEISRDTVDFVRRPILPETLNW